MGYSKQLKLAGAQLWLHGGGGGEIKHSADSEAMNYNQLNKQFFIYSTVLENQSSFNVPRDLS